MTAADKHEIFVRACINHDDAGVLAAIGSGLNVNFKDCKGRAPLHYAASSRNLVAAQSLLENGAEVDIIDCNGNTPLSDAVFYAEGQIALIELLLRYGANPSQPNHHGVTPTSLAASIANYDYSKVLG